jgi:hypothetical protein
LFAVKIFIPIKQILALTEAELSRGLVCFSLGKRAKILFNRRKNKGINKGRVVQDKALNRLQLKTKKDHRYRRSLSSG